MPTYFDIIASINVLKLAQTSIYKQEGSSPAWEMLYHAEMYLTKQAKDSLRGM